MGNRKQPFGYELIMGEVVICQKEAEVVKEIFRQYLHAPTSLKDVVDMLKMQDVLYDEGRNWNKNMVARILADERYRGEKGYPRLVDPEVIEAVSIKRMRRAQSIPNRQPEICKVMRKLCGRSVTPIIEQQVNSLLHTLIQDPTLIQRPQCRRSAMPSATQAELDKVMEQNPIDEVRATTLLLKHIAEQYSALTDHEYETQLLRRLFTAAQCGAGVTPELLKRTTARIIIDQHKVKLLLKNGQMIERTESA